ncbi:MAG TPA: phosphatidate cytidylyltransferase [Dehalococcoidia bacterium]
MLGQRVASAAIGVPLIILLVAIGGWPYAVAVAVVLAVAVVEFQHLQCDWLSTQSITGAAVVLALVLATEAAGSGPVLASAAISVVGAAAAGGIWIRRYGDTTLLIAWLALGVLYVGVLGSTFVLLRNVDNGRDWVYLTLFSTFAVDTAAYFSGRAIGRHKLAPRISPKKTWEGFIGGWAGGFAVAVALNYLLGLRIEARDIVLIAAVLPLAAAAGDLVESAIKRWTGVKDASELIPGHGGVLDRLDSLLFTFPVVYLIARAVVLS